MAFVESSLCKAVFLVAFTLGVQKTAAQSVLCDQYGVLNSTSGQYISKFHTGASNTTGDKTNEDLQSKTTPGVPTTQEHNAQQYDTSSSNPSAFPKKKKKKKHKKKKKKTPKKKK